MKINDKLANALAEAILRVTDGALPLSSTQLREVAEELTTGERTFGDDVDVTLGATGFAINLRPEEKVVPADKRRPAPTMDEAYAALSDYVKGLEERARADGATNADELKWLRIPQPTYSPDTPFDELPQRIIRQCCVSKTCGGTVLYKSRTEYATSTGGKACNYEYLRASNDEHADMSASTLGGLIDLLNDAERWPNRWSEFWEYTSADTDALGPDGLPMSH